MFKTLSTPNHLSVTPLLASFFLMTACGLDATEAGEYVDAQNFTTGGISALVLSDWSRTDDVALMGNQNQMGRQMALDNDVMVAATGILSGPDRSLVVYERDSQDRTQWPSSQAVFYEDDLSTYELGTSLAIDDGRIAATSRHHIFLLEEDSSATDGWDITKVIHTGDLSDDYDYGVMFHSIDIDGDHLIAGVMASASDNVGGAHIFDTEEDSDGDLSLNEVASLDAPSPYSDSTDWHFGLSVAIDGNTAVVTAPDSVLGDEIGKAFVYQAEDGDLDQWELVEELSHSSLHEGAYFGTSASLDGDTVAIGSIGYGEPSYFSGAVYIFERDLGGDDAWGYRTRLQVDEDYGGAHLGSSLDLVDDNLIVGAPESNEPPGDGTRQGAAYFFSRHEGGPHEWGRVERRDFPDDADRQQFGTAVGLTTSDANDDATAAVAAPRTHVNTYYNSGEIYFYHTLLPPEAEHLSLATEIDEDLTISIADSDPDVSIESTTDSEEGSASHTDDEVTYSPDPDFEGEDQFEYTLINDNDQTATATITVSVTPPIPIDDLEITTEKDTPAVIPIDDVGPLIVVDATDPSNGSTTFEDHEITYAPEEGFTGEDHFDYTLEDIDSGLSASASVTVTVLTDDNDDNDDNATADTDDADVKDGDDDAERSDTARRVHRALTGSDMEPGDEGFGEAVSNRARSGQPGDLGRLVSRAAQGDELDEDGDLELDPRERPGPPASSDADTSDTTAGPTEEATLEGASTSGTADADGSSGGPPAHANARGNRGNG